MEHILSKKVDEKDYVKVVQTIIRNRFIDNFNSKLIDKNGMMFKNECSIITLHCNQDIFRLLE